MKYHFPNTNNNEWIDKYNKLVDEVASKEDYYKEYKKHQSKRDDKHWENYTLEHVGIHHIIPKKIDMTLLKDKNNFLYIPLKHHLELHYYLWKADPKYASHFWFICIAARKMKLWDLPRGENEYRQLAKDTALSRKK